MAQLEFKWSTGWQISSTGRWTKRASTCKGGWAVLFVIWVLTKPPDMFSRQCFLPRQFLMGGGVQSGGNRVDLVYNSSQQQGLRWRCYRYLQNHRIRFACALMSCVLCMLGCFIQFAVSSAFSFRAMWVLICYNGVHFSPRYARGKPWEWTNNFVFVQNY